MMNISSRRDFLKMSSFVLAVSFLAACNLPIPPTNTTPVAVTSTNSNPPPVAVTPANSNPPSAAIPSTNSTPPFVLNSPLDDTPEVFMNTYYGAVGASPPTPRTRKASTRGWTSWRLRVHPSRQPQPGPYPGSLQRSRRSTTARLIPMPISFLKLMIKTLSYYIFEPLQSLFVVEGQVVNTGDILGTLADNRGQNLRGTKGTGTLDFGLISIVDGSWARICFVPYASSSFRTLMETWFSRAYTATAEHPGPCVCHYHYP